MTLRASSTETRNGASASVSHSVTVRVLPGAAVPTPAGVNPFVVSTASAQAFQTLAGSGAIPNPNGLALAALSLATGQFGTESASAPLPKTAAEIAQAEAERSRSLSDAWLKQLEDRAKAQWQQLVGGH